jgi:hypothetical protein
MFPWIQAVVGLAQLALAAKAQKDAKKAAKKAQAADAAAMAKQEERASKLDALGRPLMDGGKDNLDIVQQYLRRMAGGDRAATMQALAPELNAVSEQFRGSAMAQRGMFPRGGMGPAATADLARQQQSQVNNLIFGARPQAINQLSQLGSGQAQLGLGVMGAGAGLSNNMLDYGLQSRQQMYNWGRDSGEGMSNALNLLGTTLGGMQRQAPDSQTGTSGVVPGSISGQKQPRMWGDIGGNTVGGSIGTGSNSLGGPYQSPNNPYTDFSKQGGFLGKSQNFWPSPWYGKRG